MDNNPEVPLKITATGEVKIYDKDGNLKQVVQCEPVDILTTMRVVPTE